MARASPRSSELARRRRDEVVWPAGCEGDGMPFESSFFPCASTLTTVLPSRRVTSIPEAYEDAVAFEAELVRSQRTFATRLVPTRLGDTVPAGLPVRSAFLLAHVDGEASIAEIAAIADVPVLEAYERFVDLKERGLLALGFGVPRADFTAAPPASVLRGSYLEAG